MGGWFTQEKQLTVSFYDCFFLSPVEGVGMLVKK